MTTTKNVSMALSQSAGSRPPGIPSLGPGIYIPEPMASKRKRPCSDVGQEEVFPGVSAQGIAETGTLIAQHRTPRSGIWREARGDPGVADDMSFIHFTTKAIRKLILKLEMEEDARGGRLPDTGKRGLMNLRRRLKKAEKFQAVRRRSGKPNFQPRDQSKPEIEAIRSDVSTAEYGKLGTGSKRRKVSTEDLKPKTEAKSEVAKCIPEAQQQIDATKEGFKISSMSTTEPTSGPESQNVEGFHESLISAALSTTIQSASTNTADKPTPSKGKRQKAKVSKLGGHEKPHSKRRAKSTPDQGPPLISAEIANEWSKMTGRPWCSREDSRAKEKKSQELYPKKHENRLGDVSSYVSSYDWCKQHGLPKIRQPGGSPFPLKGRKRTRPDSAEDDPSASQQGKEKRRKLTGMDVTQDKESYHKADEQSQRCLPPDYQGSAPPRPIQWKRAKLKSQRQSDMLHKPDIEASSSKTGRGQPSHDSNISSLLVQRLTQTDGMQTTVHASLSQDSSPGQPESISEAESDDKARSPPSSPLSTHDTSKVVSFKENGDEELSGTSTASEKTNPSFASKEPIKDQKGILSPKSSSQDGDSTSDDWESCSDGGSSSSQSSVFTPSAVEDYFDNIEKNIVKWCLKTERAGTEAGQLAKETEKKKSAEAKTYLPSSHKLSVYRAILIRRRELLDTNLQVWSPKDTKFMESRPVVISPPLNAGYEVRAKVHIDGTRTPVRRGISLNEPTKPSTLSEISQLPQPSPSSPSSPSALPRKSFSPKGFRSYELRQDRLKYRTPYERWSLWTEGFAQQSDDSPDYSAF